MAGPNTEHMIEEIRANVRSGDRLKARLVLAHIGEVDERTQNRLVYEMSRGQPSFSVPLLCYLLSDHPTLADSLSAIRELLFSSLIAYPEQINGFLLSADISDKTPIIQLVGEMKYEHATSALLELIDTVHDEALILLIIETLGDIGDPQAINTLTDYLYAANREMILAAVRALGQVGTPTAMHRLAERMGTDNEIDFKILSIFAEVQDQVSLDKLNDTLRSHYAHMRTFAKQELITIGPKSVPLLIENLRHHDQDFLIHSLNVLGEIGDESAVKPIRKLLESEPRDANVRFAAYEALALLPLRKGAYTLTAGLSDAEEHVCIAAARAIEKNYSDIIVAGLKNLLRSDDDEAHHITKIIVDAQVDRLFLSLAREDFFLEMALAYLPRTHRDIRAHYAGLLRKAGFAEAAAKILGEQETTIRPKVVAVDDSRMILNIYKATLHELGYEPVLFEFPGSALDWLRLEKPLLVLTDLNMPEITGIQLTEKIREIYPAKILPIIMVTTQNEAMDNEAARTAGVNRILHKPFSAASLKAAMADELR
ncbi:HEAT repeat domain-containing protein [Desulfofustis glycolicus]|uniref:HEAT repeat-containing protein n=1 Tax=Desulfofustis glycolicus DSM 9705 TaxID=1121409 RepID=A0A1M5XWZ2_9BACT|nr:HEAT repeat domain-containing protein [Desulfofustis glycolicus]MCB2215484.1 HEAT repeat domain-containing protein [Desulfobulbaceae bacterium]SHI04351.1 HEAT repeat-containing protein [Desulfofustis glycolicus DSM 9705]